MAGAATGTAHASAGRVAEAPATPLPTGDGGRRGEVWVEREMDGPSLLYRCHVGII